jgi:hypothetical protein
MTDEPSTTLVTLSDQFALPHPAAQRNVCPRAAVENDYDDMLGGTSFWCECTQKAFGPDGDPVNARDCVDGRKCCEH